MMRQALRWACVSCRAGLLVITSFPSHAAREGRGGEGRRAPSLSLVAGNTCPGSPQDLPDSQCGQGALRLLMQMGFLPNLVGGAEHPHSSPHPSDTHPTRTWGVSPSRWVGVVFADVSEVGHRFLWCLLEQGGYYQNIVKTPLSLPLATERGFCGCVVVACITCPDCLCLRLQAQDAWGKSINTQRTRCCVTLWVPRSGCLCLSTS